ncbi:helix-turn-helix domain-containing protein [Urbifossiella limnaea]|uniref:Helix-turn-helix domain-containing protein n=1 Tax=Urbifossiella limnaea TaxID=2528023 RepID=A0A517XR56_9BACT|nr:helix-turn-helix domain-containing protein [Urbifossiella limnaea]QDU19986.1 hypothetical protein ETAA1_19290 [Urbifossiella limnaea]
MTTNPYTPRPGAPERHGGVPNTPDRLAVDQCEAARLSGLSAKTLGRLADRGERVGRIKIGRRVMYHLATMRAWLAARASGHVQRHDAEGGGQ